MSYQSGKPYFVICRSMSEFITYRNIKIKKLEEAGERYTSLDFIFVGDLTRIRGYRNVHGAFYGNWKLNPNIKEILETLHYMNSDTEFQLPESIRQYYFKEFVENIK